MTITAEVIADSVSDAGRRITTLQLRYPKFIHGEFMTHRVFSRNASSSRAIPVERLIQDVVDDPVYPSYWGKNQRGMQAAEECTARIWLNALENWAQNDYSREQAWDVARDHAVDLAQRFSDAGYHKQIVNRLLESFCHINVVVTATEWSNFFALRCHPDAQPEMRLLAEAMRDAMAASTPRLLAFNPDNPFHWHLPYVGEDEWKNWPQDLVEGGDGYSGQECRDNLIKLSVSRCARVSYLTHEGKAPNVEEDFKLYDRLIGSVPLHASPCEHQATPDTVEDRLSESKYGIIAWKNYRLHGNFIGWIQYRKTLPGECQ